MALRETVTPALQADLRALALALDAAKQGESGGLVQDFMARYGWKDQNRVYRHLNAIGWRSGRKRRADAGTSAVSDEAVLKLGAAVRTGLRENGKQTLEVPNAVSLLSQNGVDIPVGPARVRTLLRQRQLHTAAARQSPPSVAMKSLHPNHVHQVDPSLCLIYYTPDGKQNVLHDSEIYRNKPEWVEKTGNLKCWRYVLTDHRSAVVIVRYYAAKGETQANLYDFLLYAWRHWPHLQCPFHGVPLLLIWDKGSANGAAAIKNALRSLGVEDIPHAKGNARAKGQVENANNLVEKLFESRLKFEPVASVDALNAAAERWYVAYNANAIPRLDTRLRRPGLEPASRYALWQTIRQEQLRILPDDATCRHLLSAGPENRTVRGTAAGGLSIQFAHPATKRVEYFDLARVPGVVKGMKVQVSPLFYGAPGAVLVSVEDYKGDVATHALEPVAWDEAGHRTDAPVLGENFKANPDTQTEKAAKAADRAAYPDLDEKGIEKAKAKGDAPFGGLDAHSHLGKVYVPAFLARPGTALDVPNPVQVPARILTATELCLALRDRLSQAWTPDMGRQVFQAHPEGAPESEAAAIADWLMAGGEPAPGAANERPKLWAVK